MKGKYPTEAFALGMILFSAGLKEALAAGSLMILTAVFAEFLKNLLKPLVPAWSSALCAALAAGSLCASAFLLGFWALGIEMDAGTWSMTFLLGLLAARHVLRAELQAEYGELLWECAVFWGFWVLLAAVREFLATGAVFGSFIVRGSYQSKGFLDPAFGLLGTGLALAFTNGLLKKRGPDAESLLLALPLIIFARPLEMVSLGPLAGLLWTILAPAALFVSCRQTLKFSRTSSSFRGLPTELLTLGFIYMILGLY